MAGAAGAYHQQLHAARQRRLGAHGRYLGIYYGGYESFGNDKRLILEGRLQPDGSGPFVGFRSIIGDGQDDIRIFAGFHLKLDTVANLFRAQIPGELIPGEKKSEETK